MQLCLVILHVLNISIQIIRMSVQVCKFLKQMSCQNRLDATDRSRPVLINLDSNRFTRIVDDFQSRCPTGPQFIDRVGRLLRLHRGMAIGTYRNQITNWIHFPAAIGLR